MALQIDYTKATGTLLSAAYLRLLEAHIYFTGGTANLVLGVFQSKSLSDAGKDPEVTVNYLISGPDFTTYFAPAALKAANGDVKAQAYAALRATQAQLISATNV